MSLAQRIRRAFAGPAVDADGWYTRSTPMSAPEYDTTWADDMPPLDERAERVWAALDRDRRNDRLGIALPCARWRRGAEHDDHVWDNDGTVAQCPGWRGEP